MTRPPKSPAAPAALCPLNLHRKTLGAIAEHLFTAITLSLGFMVSKPVLENSRYDLILDLAMANVVPDALVRKGRAKLGSARNLKLATRNCAPPLLRVQVKSAWTLTYGKWGQGRYQIATGCGPHLKRRYTTDDIDFLAAYLAPLEIAHVVPDALVRKGGAPGRPDVGLLGCKGGRKPAPPVPTTEDRRPTAAALTRGTWYIIPAHEITHCLSLYFSPNPTTSRLMKYRDRWDLLLS